MDEGSCNKQGDLEAQLHYARSPTSVSPTPLTLTLCKEKWDEGSRSPRVNSNALDVLGVAEGPLTAPVWLVERDFPA